MHLVLHNDEPTSYKETLGKPHWHAAMNAEFTTFISQNTWILVPPPQNQHVLGSKLMFKTKLNANGIVARYKTRLAAQGYKQREGTDYNETFNPVAKMTTV